MNYSLDEIKQFTNIELLAKQMVEGFITGLHKSPYHGFSVEFAEHRLYNTGESTRHVDWKIYAKTDRLYTKRYEEETNLRCQIVIDQSSSMYYPEANYGKMKFSVLAAAAITYLLHKQRDAVGLHTFSDQLELETQVKSSASHIHKLFIQYNELLEKQKTTRRTNVSSILHQLAEKVHRRSLVVIFSDMFDNEENEAEVLAALQHLKHKRHEVLLFHVTDHKTELDFDFEDRPYEFIDAETKEKVKLNPASIKKDFKKQMDAYHKELYMKCAKLKIDLIEADINQGFDQVLKSYLIKRGKMR
ncbi:MAG: DUF58 domain-containing protein [Cytophagales bacterium CG12_big_fil_rev_8_21_14_0_65_40_12]|nr:MAG: DUF58 domain-containing protein [Cytophagales bacterium CG12_big_fil_rev_8_21_14_0_65_40_12]PIW04641.1 MAG: DUF58 domain-containing protein [Cytophagales bacterium CG17_big_fil_post_rev_8_21_14_2_50_40_13]